MPAREQFLPVAVRIVKDFKTLRKDLIALHDKADHVFEISIILLWTFLKTEIQRPEIHQLYLAIKCDADILQRYVAMVDTHVVQLWVSLKELIDKWLKILCQFPKLREFSPKSFRKIFHNCIAIALSLNYVMNLRYCLLHITIVGLEFQIATYMFGNRQGIDPKNINLLLIVFNAEANLPVKTAAEKLFRAVRNRIVFYFLFDCVFFIHTVMHFYDT